MIKKILLTISCAFVMAQSFSQVNSSMVSSSLKSLQGQYSLSDNDIQNFKITDQYTSSNNGVTHVYLRQTINNLEVFNTQSALHFDKNAKLIYHTMAFVNNAATKL